MCFQPYQNLQALTLLFKVESLRGKSTSKNRLLCKILIQIVLLDLPGSAVCRCVQKFKSGRFEFSLKHNCDRTRSETDGINTAKVAQIFNSGR